MNSVILTGQAATEPELRYTPNGKAVVSFRLGVPTGRKSNQGKEFVDYFTITCWGDLAEKVAEKLNKGATAFVQGRLGNESYTKNDKKVWVTKVTASSVDIFAGPETTAPSDDEEAADYVDGND